MFDYHIHSDFSADCTTPMEKTIEKAIDLGLEEICFTEHIDYDYPDESIVFEFDLKQYDKKIKQLQAAYADRIRIKKGVEIGLQPYLLDRYISLMDKESFDFVICSMHTTEQKDLHSGDFFNGKTVEEAYQAYYEELLHCIKHYKRYSVLGHIDLIKRYSYRAAQHDFHDIIGEIFKQVIADGKGIELNTSGIRYKLEHGMPSPDILQLYKDCGGEIISLGSDSHTETSLAYDFNASLQLLESLGFQSIATYEKGIPSFHPISELRR